MLSVAWRIWEAVASIIMELKQEGQAGEDDLGVPDITGWEVGEGRSRAREELSPGRNRATPGRGGSPATVRKEDQSGAGRATLKGGRGGGWGGWEGR